MQLRRESQLMPRQDRCLPLQVPIPRILDATPLVVRHPLVPGHPIAAPAVEDGRAIGEFLRALHQIPDTEAVRHGLAPAAETQRRRLGTTSRLRANVMPLSPVSQRDSANPLLIAMQEFPIDTIVPGDVGPDQGDSRYR